ncbi:MAG: HEAT repeat domain-containing protein [Gemmatimonadaceae bacterium]|nr:HEAT repeat domain-containing protein [Gemmatimonadaceae bacterium]
MGILVAATVAVVQLLFLVLLLAFLVVRRVYDRRQAAAFEAGKGALSAPLRAWLVAGAHPEPVVAVLRGMPRGTAVGYLALLARQTIPDSNREELARALRGEHWVRHAVRQAGSRFWWRRLEAARALSVTADAAHRAIVQRLFFDTHPAVQVAAAGALPRVADAVLVGLVLDRLDSLPKVVRHYVTGVLRRARELVAPALAERIARGGHFATVAAWVELAEAIAEPAAVAASIARVGDPSPAVRRAIAKALRRAPSPAAEAALVTLLADRDPTVRAAAARTVGELGLRSAVPALVPVLGDGVWIVRVRAAVSLAQLGERGKAALREARAGGDRFARDMAAMVTGLTEGAILEMGDA